MSEQDNVRRSSDLAVNRGLVNETVEILKTPKGNDPRSDEKVIKDAWDYDSNEGRAKFKDFADFRQQVLNAL